jgi:MFS family permease
MTFLAIKLYQLYPFKSVLQVAALFLLVGSWIRTLAPVVDSFSPIIIGSFVQSIGHVMTQQSQNIVINKWFGDKERALAVSISMAGLPLGSLIGFICTGVSFSNKDALATDQLDKLIAG